MVICDCTTLTQAGYVGDDIESVIVKLLHVSLTYIHQQTLYVVTLTQAYITLAMWLAMGSVIVKLLHKWTSH